jgi:large subunit ribosomal protein L6
MINNHIIGVTQGYKKTLKLIGTGYRAKKKGLGIELAVGYSHSVDFIPTAGVKIELEGEDTIYISGIDKQAVGQVAANIRAIKPPEPYKGKGIRYEDELVKIKPGKTAAE